MRILQLLLIIIIGIQAVLLNTCGYTVENAEFWISLLISMVVYWKSCKEFSVKNYYIKLGVYIIFVVGWVLLVCKFAIKGQAFLINVISTFFISCFSFYKKKEEK